ncbi:MAG: protein translocase subunit SecD, partial [Planctomycetes bacterium]|nr:protein translocase subunit SecD [Planctomycetota bacterium]
DARSEYEDQRASLLARVIDADDLEQALLRSNVETIKIDRSTGEKVNLGSPRQLALERIREGQPLETLAQIDRIVEAWNTYESNRRSLDDPEDLKRLLRGAGVLDFRITVDPGTLSEEQQLRDELSARGPRNTQSTVAAWYKINRTENWFDSVQDARLMRENPAAYFADPNKYRLVGEEFDGEYYILCYTSSGNVLITVAGDNTWAVESAFQGPDQLGRPAINFRMNTIGGRKMAALTDPHVGDHMAVLLDDQVYTAPTLQGRISASGQITGDFSREEIDYLIRTLNAGSLQAKLAPEPISENQVGPSLGLDQLRHGMNAGLIAIVGIALFMLVYYFDVCGGIAVLSLLCNALLILGVMAANRAAFTLPGIAGVILTFGMAVDANVLIYERMREELRQGVETRAAVRLGYQKALSSIIDGNVTNLIVCLVLYYTGTQEIRGFAITLGIGVLATLFSVLVIGRLFFDVLVEGLRFKRISMLPMVVPAIERVLTPKLNWMGLRWTFTVLSVSVVALSLGLIATRGKDMLGIEFRGGTKITLEFKHEDPDDRNSPRLTMTRPEVAEKVHAIGRVPDDPDDPDYSTELPELEDAIVVPLNPELDGITSDTFEIRTLHTRSPALLQRALAEAFESMLDMSQQSLTADRIDETDVHQAPVYPLIDARLDRNSIPGMPPIDVKAYVGGIAIYLKNISPPVTLDQLESRLERMREQPDFSRTLGRKREIRVLEKSPDDPDRVTSAVLLVFDEGVSFWGNEDVWWVDLAATEWRVAVQALTQAPPPASMQSFSPAIARAFVAQALMAVVVSFMLISIYIWVRFGSVRYSLAALICLIHDVIIVVGMVALAGFLWDTTGARPVLQQMKVLPFRIDLNLVAALLTIIGYSLNDTIIIMDRIRENRGKLPYASREAVNNAVNSTISRTVITSGTTFIAAMILYTYGGEGVRAFSFALACGVIVGTYSSVAIAAPLVWSQRKDRTHQAELAQAEQNSSAGT